MKYKGKDDWILGDTWGLVADGKFHGIHIKWSNQETPLGHIVSSDLLHYEFVDDVFHPLPEDKYPQDCLMKYTGCAITGKDKKHYIYYTMRNKNADEKIAVAFSDDMKDFVLYDKNPVLEPDENIFYTKGPRIDCRDMIVVYYEKEDVYYGYFAAMADIGYDCPCGVIGVAKSKDLLNWREQKIAYKPPFMGVMEVPDVFEIDGKWYLIMLSGNNYGAKGISEDEDIVCFTYYAVSDSPEGPFVHTDDTIFLGGNESGGAVCRSVVFEGKRYIIYLDRGKEGGALSLPKEIGVVDGKLRPLYAPITNKLRTGNLTETYTPDMIEGLTGSHAWETISGDAKITCDGKRLELSTYVNSWQKYRLKDIRYKSLELECTVSGDATEFGFMFEAYAEDKPEKPKETSYVALNLKQNKIIAYYNRISFIPYSKRKYALQRDKEYHIRMMVMEGVFEIYVDDVLILQGPMETADYIVPGLLLGNGKCEIKNLIIYELEK